MWWMAGGAMAHKHLDNKSVNEYWKEFLETGYESSEHRLCRIFGFLPSTHRCKICFSPFDGAPRAMARFIFDKRPSNMSPQICNFCEDFAKKHQGGAEVELTMLFVDVRGSTTLAESMPVSEFSQLINRFYITASDILVRTEAWIDKIIGDQVTGLYFPGLAGPDYTQKAIEAALKVPGSRSARACIVAWRMLERLAQAMAHRISRCSEMPRIPPNACLPVPVMVKS
jgi:adenylate cyclase